MHSYAVSFFTLHFLFLLGSIVRQLDLCTLWFISTLAKTFTALLSVNVDSLFAQTHVYTHRLLRLNYYS